MFIAPSSIWNPPFFYYFAIPPIQAYTLKQTSISKETPPKIQNQKYEYEPQIVEKLILTQDDLIKQGYQQTKKAWTQEQDRLLLQLCKNQDARFQQISSKIQGRNAKMCYSRYRRLNYQKRVGWSKHDNQKLLQLINHHGDSDWKLLASFFQGKTHKQLKDHYKNYLNPNITKTQWTLQEDLQLIKLINLYGKDWRMIEQGIRGRSRNQIKNRYFGKLTRMNKKKLSQLQNPVKIEISLAY